MLWANFRYFCNLSVLGRILVVLEVLGLFNDFRGNLVILVFYGHFGHFLLFQGSFDYLSDFRGILVILQVFWVYFISF